MDSEQGKGKVPALSKTVPNGYSLAIAPTVTVTDDLNITIVQDL